MIQFVYLIQGSIIVFIIANIHSLESITMGCETSIDQVTVHRSNISRKILQRIGFFKKRNLIATMGSFLPSQELREMEYTANSLSETINTRQLYKMQAGQSYLLSKQRRLAWKISIFEHCQKRDIFQNHKFTESPNIPNDSVKQRFYEISLDVNRTFPSTQQLNRSDLKIVLQNLSLYFEAVGYTQGMNFHIGFLLLCGFTPLETYQIFIRLSHNPRYLLIRNFTQNFLNVNICIKVMEHSIMNGKNDKLKEVKQKIQGFGMTLFIFVFSWFLSYFLYNFNVRSSLLIWDYLILHSTEKDIESSGQFKNSVFGHGFLNSINLALRIIQFLSDKIIQCQGLQIIMQILRHDSLQKQINEQLIEELIIKCKAEPLVSEQSFRLVLKTEDQELNSIYTYPKQKDEDNPLQEFLSKCKYPRRIINIQKNQSFS